MRLLLAREYTSTWFPWSPTQMVEPPTAKVLTLWREGGRVAEDNRVPSLLHTLHSLSF